MSTEQLHSSAESHESDDDEKDSGPSNSPTASRWTRPPLPMARPMFEHVVPMPEVSTPKSESKDDDEEDDKADDTAPPRADSAAATAAPDVEAAAQDNFAEVPQETVAEQAPDEAVLEAEPMPSAQELVDEWVLYPNQEPAGEPVGPEYSTAPVEEDEEDVPLTASTGAPPPPPPPPTGPPAGSSAELPDPDPVLTSRARLSWNTAPQLRYYNSAPSVSLEQHQAALQETEQDAERRGLRRGLVAGFITGYVVKAYLARKKFARYEKETEKRLNQRDESIDRLQKEQYKLNQQVGAQSEQLQARQRVEQAMTANTPDRFEQPTDKTPRPIRSEQLGKKPEAAALAKNPEEQLFDQEGNEIVLQPGWHVERSSGGYSVVLDERNRVVYDAIRYGEAFKRDQRREQVNDDAFGANGTTTALPEEEQGVFAAQPLLHLQSTRIDPGHALEPGDLTVDVQHRLPKPRSLLVVILTSPWLWTAVAVLLIVYFLATLA